jgi:macrodomain Ter protein organizer (MatP/YcbG family)
MTPDSPDGTLQYLWCVESDWKLLLRFKGKDTTKYKNTHIWDKVPTQLYNLKNDPHEHINVADKHPNIVSRLRKMINAWHPDNRR